MKNLQKESAGGAYTYQQSLLQEILKLNTEHEIVIYYKNKNVLFEDKRNVHFVNLFYEKKDIIAKKFFFKIRKTVKVTLNDLVLRDNIELLFFVPPGFENVSIPYVFTLWDLDHKQTPYFPEVSVTGFNFDAREKFYSSAIQKASFVVIGNVEGKRQVCRYYNVNNDLVITNPMPTPSYIYNSVENKDVLVRNNLINQQYLFYPAQFWPHKNHIRLVKALKVLKEQGYNYKMVFTGADKGNENYIKEKTLEYGLENDVLFLGFVSQEELIALYKNAYALTFASYMGPDNIPPLEAMGLGCPVISSNTAGMQEQLKDAALFFDPKSEKSLVEQIIKLEDKKHRENLISKGYELAKQYNMEKYVDNLLRIAENFQPIRECWSNKELYIHL